MGKSAPMAQLTLRDKSFVQRKIVNNCVINVIFIFLKVYRFHMLSLDASNIHTHKKNASCIQHLIYVSTIHKHTQDA